MRMAFADEEIDDSLHNYLKVSGGQSATSRSESDTDSCSEEEHEVSSIYSEVLTIAGEWGARRFQKHPWCKCKRRTVKIQQLNQLELDDSEKGGLLSHRMVAARLSFAEKLPIVLKYAYSKCVLHRLNLVDITALKTYTYIQYLDISHNYLSSLAPLGQLPFLQYLDASHNTLSRLLDFRAPFYLTYVDVSNNFVQEIPDLTKFWSIVTLKLAHNQIEKISGLQTLRFLTHLDLSNNRIKKLENLGKLRIQKLFLSGNSIDSFEDDTDGGSNSLEFLVTVDLSKNMLTTLQLFKNCENLEHLKMCKNQISNLLELYYLKNLRFLHCLNLSDNPVTSHAQYVDVCILTLKGLRKLDNSPISPEQKVDTRFRHSSDPSSKASEDRLNLLLMEHFNDPVIGAHVIPYDQPPPSVILVVGPVCSKKKAVVLEFVEQNKWAILGISHTTRPKQKNEQEGKHYYYVDRMTFKNMIMKGEFVTVSETYGHMFGIAHKELEKCQDGVLVFDGDLTTALIMKVIGINPKIVLAIPQSELTHLEWLARNYFFQYLDYNSVLVQKCADTTTNSTEEESSNSSDSIVMERDGDVDRSETFESVHLVENIHECLGTEFEDDRDINFRDEEPIIAREDDRSNVVLSDSSKSGILKRKSSSKENDRHTAVSFSEQYKAILPAILEYKFENKKVSFGWLQAMELEWFKDKMRHKSISDTMLLSGPVDKTLPATCDVHCPLLSVLSSQDMAADDKQQETVYMTFTERFDQMQKETLDIFFKSVIKTRNELLELHWENPGLFRDIIFTDDIKGSLSKLKDILRSTVQNRRCNTVSFEEDKDFVEALNLKIQKLNLEENKYLK